MRRWTADAWCTAVGALTDSRVPLTAEKRVAPRAADGDTALRGAEATAVVGEETVIIPPDASVLAKIFDASKALQRDFRANHLVSSARRLGRSGRKPVRRSVHSVPR